jgi:hypothetical protein
LSPSRETIHQYLDAAKRALALLPDSAGRRTLAMLPGYLEQQAAALGAGF